MCVCAVDIVDPDVIINSLHHLFTHFDSFELLSYHIEASIVKSFGDLSHSPARFPPSLSTGFVGYVSVRRH